MTVRALTIRQPHASLVAVGAKTIETRSKPTSYRGPLLIHAGLDYSAMYRWYRGWHATDVAMAIPGIMLHESFLLGYAGRNGYRRKPTFTIYGAALPLGAVVASCQLIDCVPILDSATADPEFSDACVVVYGDPSVSVVYFDGDDGQAESLVDQLPFGDFSPGRYAWLLDDVKPTTERCPRCWGKGWHDRHDYAGSTGDPVGCRVCAQSSGRFCAPVPMRGRQGLWAPTAEDWSPR